MANISEKVGQIRKAIYGKDVRESIASGIEAINDHVETIVEAEVTREANEVERENAEEIRETNERARETAEGVRVEAEIARQIEVTNARESTVKSKTFATLGERLEESEQDLDNHETAADPHDQYALDTDLATLQTEVTSHKAENVNQGDIPHIGLGEYFAYTDTGNNNTTLRQVNELCFSRKGNGLKLMQVDSVASGLFSSHYCSHWLTVSGQHSFTVGSLNQR